LNELHQLHGTGGVHYLWSSPTMVINNATSQDATAMLTNDANFFLEVKDAIGCVGYDSVFVQAFAGPTYHVPNAFSPNGDGLNDVFRAIPAGMSTTTYFRVFNRYGQMVFETNQWLKGWDGKYNGQDAPSGAYVWMVKGMDRNKRIIEMSGTVMLVR
jgi:gliding motility-associated-like protein